MTTILGSSEVVKYVTVRDFHLGGTMTMHFETDSMATADELGVDRVTSALEAKFIAFINGYATDATWLLSQTKRVRITDTYSRRFSDVTYNVEYAIFAIPVTATSVEDVMKSLFEEAFEELGLAQRR